MKSKHLETEVKEFKKACRQHYRRLQLIVLTDLITAAQSAGYRITGLSDFHGEDPDDDDDEAVAHVFRTLRSGNLSISDLLDDWLNNYEDTWLLFTNLDSGETTGRIRFISIGLAPKDGWICDWSDAGEDFKQIVQAAQDNWLYAIEEATKLTKI